MRAGIDLGGTKIEGILMDSAGAIVARRRVPTPGDYAKTLAALESLIADLERDAGAAASHVGVGLPGSPSPATGLIRNANSTWLNGMPFVADLSQTLRRPVRAANDANCFALSEAVDGAAAGAESVFGVILGTGCGGGLVIDGKLIAGVNGVAGEWGHNPLPWPRSDETPGPACWCGKRGCMETWVSGPGLEADYERRAGERLAAAAIAARETPLARAVMRDHVDRLARGLATIVNTIDPNVIVLGGGVSNIAGLSERIAEALPAYVFSDVVRTRIVRNAHGDSSGVRGAAWLWPAP